MGCGASMQPVDGRVNDWRIWNALDLKEEEDKFKLAMLFRFLEQQAAKESGVPLEKHEEDEDEPTPHFEQVSVDVGYVGLVLTVPLERGSARDLLEGFTRGEPLHQKFAWMVCHEALTVLQREGNINRVAAPQPGGHKVVVVGDLHGSLGDLRKIINEHGSPSDSTIYVFNGDFVDRGPHGVEVLLVLLALKALHPQHMMIDRGNHEDIAVTSSYGFREEVSRKYNEQTYQLFVKVFKWMPLCTVVGQDEGNGLFIVHGGLFSDQTVTLEDIEGIRRNKYSSVLMRHIKDGSQVDRHEIMLEDMLWSDPWRKPGVTPSDRGSGVLFGPDVVAKFLSSCNCKNLIRSHECVENGVEMTQISSDMKMYTVFSASNYSGGDNYGAVLVYKTLSDEPEIIRFRSSEPLPRTQIQGSNQVKLQDLIRRRHFRLLRGFQKADIDSSGKITPQVWADTMGKTLRMEEVEWLEFRLMLVGELDDNGMIPYNEFLERYGESDAGRTSEKLNDEARSMVTHLYSNYVPMQVIFNQWDTNKDGKVDRSEFRTALEMLQQLHPKEEHPMDPDSLFDLIDLNRSGYINFNELCEASRLSKIAAN